MRIFIKDSILLASDLGLTGKPIWRHSVDHDGAGWRAKWLHRICFGNNGYDLFDFVKSFTKILKVCCIAHVNHPN